MARSTKQLKAQAAWDRIEALGGHGVWESEIVIVSLADTDITDDDLALFLDFPFVQTLDLSGTKVCGTGLVHLTGAIALEKLIIVGTKLDKQALSAFRKAHPNVTVFTVPVPKGTINPFTGKPI